MWHWVYPNGWLRLCQRNFPEWPGSVCASLTMLLPGGRHAGAPKAIHHSQWKNLVRISKCPLIFQQNNIFVWLFYFIVLSKLIGPICHILKSNVYLAQGLFLILQVQFPTSRSLEHHGSPFRSSSAFCKDPNSCYKATFDFTESEH